MKKMTNTRTMFLPCLPSFLSILIIFMPKSTVSVPVGVCYGRVAANLPPSSDVVNLIKSNGISRVRLFNPDPQALRPFSGTGIELVIGIPNEVLPTLANGAVSTSVNWLKYYVFSQVDPTQIRYFAVGNEVLLKDPYYAGYVVPAMRNLYSALQTLGLAESIKLSSAHASSILSNSYPPSAGSFDSNLRSVITSLLQFLSNTGSPLMVNVYPFFSYMQNMPYVSLDYALFNTSFVDFERSLGYDNMFDATVDAFIYAMEREGFSDIPIVVSETGWPTAGAYAASPENAYTYNDNVVKRSLTNVGTPKRPGVGLEVYLFDLFDENDKVGDSVERHFGIFQLDGRRAYDLEFK